jgi:hypothetical protein
MIPRHSPRLNVLRATSDQLSHAASLGALITASLAGWYRWLAVPGGNVTAAVAAIGILMLRLRHLLRYRNAGLA